MGINQKRANLLTGKGTKTKAKETKGMKHKERNMGTVNGDETLQRYRHDRGNIHRGHDKLSQETQGCDAPYAHMSTGR